MRQRSRIILLLPAFALVFAFANTAESFDITRQFLMRLEVGRINLVLYSVNPTTDSSNKFPRLFTVVGHDCTTKNLKQTEARSNTGQYEMIYANY